MKQLGARRITVRECQGVARKVVVKGWIKGDSNLRKAMRLSLQQRALNKQSKQLRILFCGSDEFSSASLRALYELHRRKPSLVRSIDVMVRPGKPSGRSMKTIREVPIKAVAQELGLRIHERDTFTGWEPPNSEGRPINLIVAVSFGLFVPPRILKGATYGGLNVHPSLLPNLRGPAPIHHTILTGQKETGVTVQTLHEKTFDHGVILAQGPRRGLKVTDGMIYADLHKAITPIGAKLLVDSIERCLHVPPLRDIGNHDTPMGPPGLKHAPKITPLDRKLDFSKRYMILRQHRALGRLWAEIYIDETTTKRVVFEDFEEVEYSFSLTAEEYNKRPLLNQESNIVLSSTNEAARPGLRMIVAPTTNGDKAPLFYVESGDAILIDYKGKGQRKRKSLRVSKITIAGEASKPAAVALRSLQKRGKWMIGAPEGKDLGEMRQWEEWWRSEVKGFVATEEVPEDTRKYLHGPFVPRKLREKTKAAHAQAGSEGAHAAKLHPIASSKQVD